MTTPDRIIPNEVQELCDKARALDAEVGTTYKVHYDSKGRAHPCWKVTAHFYMPAVEAD